MVVVVVVVAVFERRKGESYSRIGLQKIAIHCCRGQRKRTKIGKCANDRIRRNRERKRKEKSSEKGRIDRDYGKNKS